MRSSNDASTDADLSKKKSCSPASLYGTSLARIVAEFLYEGFNGRSPGIVIATANQRAAIIRELKGFSLDVVALERSHALQLLDAKETLSTFMMDGKPDAQKFSDQMHRVIERASHGRTHCTVRIFGQMLDLLWQENERDAAIRLEVLWNQLTEREDVSLIYGYVRGILQEWTSTQASRPTLTRLSVVKEGSSAKLAAESLNSKATRG